MDDTEVVPVMDLSKLIMNNGPPCIDCGRSSICVCRALRLALVPFIHDLAVEVRKSRIAGTEWATGTGESVVEGIRMVLANLIIDWSHASAHTSVFKELIAVENVLAKLIAWVAVQIPGSGRLSIK